MHLTLLLYGRSKVWSAGHFPTKTCVCIAYKQRNGTGNTNTELQTYTPLCLHVPDHDRYALTDGKNALQGARWLLAKPHANSCDTSETPINFRTFRVLQQMASKVLLLYIFSQLMARCSPFVGPSGTAWKVRCSSTCFGTSLATCNCHHPLMALHRRKLDMPACTTCA